MSFRGYLVGLAGILLAACGPGNSEPEPEHIPRPLRTAAAMADAASDAPKPDKDDSYVLRSVKNEAAFDLLLRTKIYAEVCGNEFHFIEMQLIEDELKEQTRLIYGPVKFEGYWQDLEKMYAAGRAEAGALTCGQNNALASDWERVILPKIMGGVKLLKQSEDWESYEPVFKEGADFLLQWAEKAISPTLGDAFMAELGRAEPNAENLRKAIRNYISQFVNAAYFQKRLGEAGYRTLVSEPLGLGRDIPHNYGLYSFKTFSRYPGYLDRLTRLKIHWRLMHVRSTTSALMMDGMTSDGRVMLIGMQFPGASTASLPSRIVLLSQPSEKDTNDPEWRIGADQYLAEVTIDDTCPGDFCAVFGEDLTEAIITRQADYENRWNYELYAGGMMAFPVPDVRTEDTTQSYLGAFYEFAEYTKAQIP